MRRLSIVGILAILTPAVAYAHVTVRPRESKPGIEERYTVRVPTEGTVSTTSIEFDVPEGVTVTDVPAPAGATHEAQRDGTRIVRITWTREIKPAEVAEFTFVARNPASGSRIAWKVRQRYADGKSSDWTPATTLVEAGRASPGPGVSTEARQTGETVPIEAWLHQYDAAFNAKDIGTLATFYHPDVTIYEGGGINRGWADYRDHHLGPELKQLENLQFSHGSTVVRMLGREAAYVTSEYSIKARMGDRDIDSGGLETLILVREGAGWKIRHAHTSSRRRPASGASPGR